jgi:hypothetical protein
LSQIKGVTDFFKVFESLGSVTVEQLLAFALLIVPGFISLRIYEMRRGGESRKANESLVDVIVYSFATDVGTFGVLALVSAFVPPVAQAVTKVIVSFLGLVVLPVGLAVVWFDFRERMVSSGIVPDSASNSWEALLQRAAREGVDVAVLLTMRDGRKIGARLRDSAQMPSRVAGDDLVLNEVWTIDQERATFVDAVRGSFGMVVHKADCETIEVLRWRDVDPRTRSDVTNGDHAR